MDIGLIIIGDEILHGDREDAHFKAVKTMLAVRGLRLKWVQYISDVPADIVACLHLSFERGETVFVTGGIGATPDDHTRQSAATALGLPLTAHPEAVELINQIARERGDDLSSELQQQRLQMAEFPGGAHISPNPFNRVAGFSIASHYFVPGFPVMAHPMLEWVLDTYYQDASFKTQHMQKSAQVYDLQESQIAPLMVAIEAKYAGVQTYSLPVIDFVKDELQAQRRYHVELGVKASGDACGLLEQAWDELSEAVEKMGGVVNVTEADAL